MAHIHVGQTAVRLELNVGLDLTTAKELEIRFIKPNTIMGAFPGYILDREKGVVYYDVESIGDLDDTGQWQFWVHIKFNDDTELDSDSVLIYIYEPGKRYISHPYGQTSIDGGILMAIEAFRVIYNNNLSNLNADDVQAALDEVKNLVDTLAAADVDYSNAQSQLSASNVKGALDELKTITDDLTSNLGSEFENVVYVAKNGSDTPPSAGIPLGTLDNPYLTVQAAIDSITDASSGKLYSVVVQPGEYPEDLTFKPWVNVLGIAKNGTSISNGGTHTAWFSNGGKITIKGIDLGSSSLVVTHPQSAPGNCFLNLRNVELNNLDVNFLGAGVDSIQLRNNTVITGDCTVHSAWLTASDAAIGGTLRVDDQNSQHTHSNGHDSFSHIRGLTTNNLEVVGNSLVEYYSSQTKNSIDIDGTNAIVQADAVSLTKLENGAITTNGGSIEKMTGAHGVYYDNTVSGLTAEDVQNAIDELKTLIP